VAPKAWGKGAYDQRKQGQRQLGENTQFNPARLYGTVLRYPARGSIMTNLIAPGPLPLGFRRRASHRSVATPGVIQHRVFRVNGRGQVIQ
jgi:hypothetical protein